EAGGPLDRVEGAEDGVDRLVVVWVGLELEQRPLGGRQVLPGLGDEVGQQLGVRVGRDELYLALEGWRRRGFRNERDGGALADRSGLLGRREGHLRPFVLVRFRRKGGRRRRPLEQLHRLFEAGAGVRQPLGVAVDRVHHPPERAADQLLDRRRPPGTARRGLKQRAETPEAFAVVRIEVDEERRGVVEGVARGLKRSHLARAIL